ncbi:hypothetical protein CBOM_05917 [Ceraceosorus bombacis]|uniref:Uncharacterized protein n=1 Tax=Ceraceosorus bombacis TaxID=401625 RepID=A0A0N7LAA5_9BASI|nr:hypothetical protein CBOM_05917 [Ceraceosorus bombacis]
MSKIQLPPPDQAYLQRLNGDTAWLLSLPTYDDSAHEHCSQSGIFTLAIDPWLHTAGSTSYHPKFSREVRAVQAVVPSIEALDEQIHELVRLRSTSAARDEASSGLDAVLTAFEFTDHAHPESLANIPARVALFATQNASKHVHDVASRQPLIIAVSSWNQRPSWDGKVDSNLPQNVQLLTIPAREGWHPAWPRLHNALLILWRQRSTSFKDQGSAWKERYLLYSPHGIEETSVPPWLTRIECAGYLTGWDSHRIPLILGDKVQLGLEPALRIISKTRASRLINTHDEPKHAQGLISYLSRIQPLGGLSVDEALRIKRGDPDDQRQEAAQIILRHHLEQKGSTQEGDKTWHPVALALAAGAIIELD